MLVAEVADHGTQLVAGVGGWGTGFCALRTGMRANALFPFLLLFLCELRLGFCLPELEGLCRFSDGS